SDGGDKPRRSQVAVVRLTYGRKKTIDRATVVGPLQCGWRDGGAVSPRTASAVRGVDAARLAEADLRPPEWGLRQSPCARGPLSAVHVVAAPLRPSLPLHAV